MPDLVTELRRAVLPALKGNLALTQILPATSIHPQTAPANAPWPFVKVGVPILTGFDGTCFVGARVRYTLHSFAKPRYNGAGGMVETAEDHVGRISGAVKGALHKTRLPVAGGTVHILWSSGQRLIDQGEADAFHAIDEFQCKVMAA